MQADASPRAASKGRRQGLLAKCGNYRELRGDDEREAGAGSAAAILAILGEVYPKWVSTAEIVKLSAGAVDKKTANQILYQVLRPNDQVAHRARTVGPPVWQRYFPMRSSVVPKVDPVSARFPVAPPEVKPEAQSPTPPEAASVPFAADSWPAPPNNSPTLGARNDRPLPRRRSLVIDLGTVHDCLQICDTLLERGLLFDVAAFADFHFSGYGINPRPEHPMVSVTRASCKTSKAGDIELVWHTCRSSAVKDAGWHFVIATRDPGLRYLETMVARDGHTVSFVTNYQTLIDALYAP